MELTLIDWAAAAFVERFFGVKGEGQMVARTGVRRHFERENGVTT